MIIDRDAIQEHLEATTNPTAEDVVRLYQGYLHAFADCRRGKLDKAVDEGLLGTLICAWAVEDATAADEGGETAGVDELSYFISRLEEHLRAQHADAARVFEFTPHELDRLAEALEAMHGPRDPLRLKLLEKSKDE